MTGAATYFSQPSTPSQRQYEALRSFYLEKVSADSIAEQNGWTSAYFKKLRSEFLHEIRKGQNPYMPDKKFGAPKKSTHGDVVSEMIIDFRKQNYAITDIRVALQSKGYPRSLDAIDRLLKKEGFAPLPKRTRQERYATQAPVSIDAPASQALILENEMFTTEQGAGVLLFLPLLESLNIIPAIQKAGFPKTAVLSDVSSVLSILALKLLGRARLSHDETWNFDRALGLFSMLNVLPKNTTLSSYSYRVSRKSNRLLLTELSRIFKDDDDGVFNLDFKAIPHWGDASVLEKNWCGARSKAIKSILALIVQSPASGYLSYTDAEIKHRDQNDAVLEFVDFWKEGHGQSPKMLILDSKMTTYNNLSRLNEDGIKFITLRRRGKRLTQLSDIDESQWQKISLERAHRQMRTVKVVDHRIALRGYEGEVRQIILTDHGRARPAFLITNDFDLDVKEILKRYSRRWLVEQEIAEQVDFFHLNQPSSSLVIKVDFDLTLSLLAHNLYRAFAKDLPGFEKCTSGTLYRNFVENGAVVTIRDKHIAVAMKKKTHLPTLFTLPCFKEKTTLPWMDATIQFSSTTVS
jgi:hypothetical protein